MPTQLLAVGIGAGYCDYIRIQGIHAIHTGDGGDNGNSIVYAYYNGSTPQCIAQLTIACNAYAEARIRKIAPTNVSLDEATKIFQRDWASKIVSYQSSSFESLKPIVEKLRSVVPKGAMMFYQCFDNVDVPNDVLQPEGTPVFEPYLIPGLEHLPRGFEDGDWELKKFEQSPSKPIGFDVYQMVDDLKYFYNLFVDHAGAITMALLITILVAFFGVKALEAIFTLGAGALEPVTVVAAILAVVYLIYDSGLEQYDTQGRLAKYQPYLSSVEADVDLSLGEMQIKIYEQLAKQFVGKQFSNGQIESVKISKLENGYLVHIGYKAGGSKEIRVSTDEIGKTIKNLNEQMELERVPQASRGE
ncbi:MAG: hypothetical protein R3A11_10085 [Bdellovibrionota bacterium]